MRTLQMDDVPLVNPEVHRKAALAAELAGKSLNQ